MGIFEGDGNSRTIPQASTELMQLLAGGASADLLAPIVAELETGYASVHETMGVAIQHEADAANTLIGIRKILSDPRLSALGIISHLALPEDDEK